MNEFLERYKKLGSVEEQFEVGQCIRVNTLKTSHSAIVNRLKSKGVKLEKIPYARDGFFVRQNPFSLGTSIESLLGYFYVQESASQLPVEVLAPKETDIVLDMCSAPGGKTTQTSQWMNNKGVVVAFEKNNRRLLAFKSNCERLGVNNVVAFNTNAEKASSLNLKFDRVLLDAPCSGNFIADKSWFQKHSVETVKSLCQIQKSLLKAGISVLKKNGVLVYCTCSLEPEENELLIDWALQNLDVALLPTNLKIGSEGLTNVFGKKLSAEVRNCRRFWPSNTKTQGFFIAKMVRK